MLKFFSKWFIVLGKYEMIVSEMEVKNEENQPSEHRQNNSAEGQTSEFSKRRWSVVTYESVAVSNLTYDEAAEWVKKLDAQKISGLCIVTDEAAARIRNDK